MSRQAEYFSCEEAPVTAEQKNAHSVHCPRCGDIVIKAAAGTLTEREVFIHASQKDGEQAEAAASNGNTFSQHWHLPNQFAFENVGVTRPLTSTGQVDSEAAADFRYLCCAACDHGPFGIVLLKEGPMWLVTHSLVKYRHAAVVEVSD
ncbi:MAG: hypothetical protein MHM6MM_004536 [Cercozoa sp. M6MM]